MEHKYIIICLIFNYINGVNINIKTKPILKKREGNIKKLQKTAIIGFLAIHFIFLNSFTSILNCGQNCCHNPAPKINTCCCEMEKECSVSGKLVNNHSFNSRCNCYHPEKTTESYLIECKYKTNYSLTDFLISSPVTLQKSYSETIVKLSNQINANSPPIYISNSSLII